MNYPNAVKFIAERRKNELIGANDAYFSALSQYSELAAADSAYRKAVLAELKGETADVEGKKAELDSLIKKLGLYEKFYPAPHCSKCDDTGFFHGKFCDCVKAIAISDDLIALPLHCFDSIDYSLFKNDKAKEFAGTAQVLKIFSADKFPDTQKRVISLIGKTGTGKTYLASCTVDAVLARGFTAVFVTAFKFISDMAKYHTTFNETRDSFLRPYLDCDLLAIDDLGTEPVYRNITLEYLYLVLNERQLAGKHTLFTSNLNIDGIAIRYGERIASRILDKRTCYVREFSGEDIRACIKTGAATAATGNKKSE